MLTCR